MTPKTRKYITGPLLPLSVLVVALLFSIIMYLFVGRDLDGRIFFYPANSGNRIGSERRGIPGRRKTGDQISVFIDEFFLGPETLELTHPVPKGTETRLVAVVDRTVYVDLTLEVLDTAGELPISLEEALSNLRYNIIYNFPRVEEVVFTIEGRQVHAPYYSGLEAAE